MINEKWKIVFSCRLPSAACSCRLPPAPAVCRLLLPSAAFSCAGMPNEIVMRHRTPQFMHVFSNDGYSAGYYSYLWSDVLTADAYGAFVEAGGPYDHKVAERLRKYIFSVGNTVDPAEAYRSFRGRDPRVEALMKKRGFSTTDSKSGRGQ
jgi:Zn-dependent oligopeptidase